MDHYQNVLKVITMMNEKRKQIMQKIAELPKGVPSKSGKYWCLTCKKWFVLDKPVCPYMTKMCVNTPIPIEEMPPESTLSIERFGLFYPKFPLKIMSRVISESLKEMDDSEKEKYLIEKGRDLAETYLNFLTDWKVDYTISPLQAIKSFVLFISGCETAQRDIEGELQFLIMDPEKVWDKNILIPLLNSAVNYLDEKLKVGRILNKKIAVKAIDLFGHLQIGKYFCSMCSMFFEFGPKKESVSCPLMPQKCMFSPTDISKMEYTPEMMDKIYRITPPLYRLIFDKLPRLENSTGLLAHFLKEDWNLNVNEDDEVVISIAKSLGLVE